MGVPKYYPILKWKQGEQNAVRFLDSADREPMIPILEIMPPGQKQLAAFVMTSLAKTFKAEPFAVDLKYVKTGGVPLVALAKLCTSLQGNGYNAWPSINSADLLAQLGQVSVLAGQPEVILRMRLQTLLLPTCAAAITAVRKAIGRNSVLHVLFEFGPIGDVDPVVLAGVAMPFLQQTFASGEANYIGFAGGSFPITLQGIPVGVNNLLPRREWHAWLSLLPKFEPLRFGDYAVTNPDLPNITNPAAMNASAAIRYALDGEWWLLRGRGTKTAGFAQYNTLCRVLISDSRYYHPPFSYGDQQYYNHAQPGAGPGNLTTWRRDATNHHLVQTVRRLAQLI
jgi:hypothetical protein